MKRISQEAVGSYMNFHAIFGVDFAASLGKKSDAGIRSSLFKSIPDFELVVATRAQAL